MPFAVRAPGRSTECAGARAVRVHDVATTVQAVRIVAEPVEDFSTAPGGAGAPALGEEAGLGPRRENQR